MGEITDAVVQQHEQAKKEAKEESKKAGQREAWQPNYELVGFVTHVGKNTGGGHYVAHIKKKIDGEDQWVIFNDRKVAISKNPPFDLGYMYFYRSVGKEE